MISKKLIERVLKVDINEAPSLKENIITYSIKDIKNNSHKFSINQFEFAFKCKEWAFSKNISIRTSHSFKFNGYLTEMFDKYNPMFDTLEQIYSKYSDTEIEGIFEACKWIINQEVPF